MFGRLAESPFVSRARERHLHFLRASRLLAAALYVILACAAFAFAPSPAVALSGPFAEFSGTWSGAGTIRPQGGEAERIRCTTTYRANGASELNIHLRCASDSYNFDLTGDLSADSNSQISGRWTESTRGIGGTVVGTARGDRMQVHVESSGFSANLVMVMHGRRQDVSFDSYGGGQIVKASISMSRR
jgi:hypothetical protein